jgi:nitrite reductase/ring-hydroxylating ferredoxin subunit
MKRVVVGNVEEIPPGKRKLVVPFRGRAGIGVFNVDGSFYAMRNICPHKSGPLCMGRVGPLVVAAAPPTAANAGLDVVQDGTIIRCPWHMWEFEIATGRCIADPTVRVKTYPVVIESGQIVVYADPADLPLQ